MAIKMALNNILYIYGYPFIIVYTLLTWIILYNNKQNNKIYRQLAAASSPK